MKVFTAGEFAGVPTDDAFALAAMRQSPVLVDISQNIAWPDGLKPQPRKFGEYKPGTKITRALVDDADVLVILYTDAETMAFLDVFTGEKGWSPQRKATWYPYAHGFDALRNDIEGIQWDTGLRDGIFGYLYPMQVGNTKVLLYKTELHPKTNGLKLPFVTVIGQLVGELHPKLVISTGTAGGIGGNINCGDVTVCNVARFHVQSHYSGDLRRINDMSQSRAELTSEKPVAGKNVAYARDTMMPLSKDGLQTCRSNLEEGQGFSFVRPVEASKLFTDASPAPGTQPMVVVSADYLTVDDKADTEDLQALGIVNETDDAFAFLAIEALPKERRPQWVSIRNASEPQIVGPSFPAGTPKSEIIEKVKDLAGTIYGIYQYCTTLNSAFTCWATIADFHDASQNQTGAD